MRGGMEAIYDDVPRPLGFMKFAPTQPARGPMFGSAQRARSGHSDDPVVSEKELYDQ